MKPLPTERSCPFSPPDETARLRVEEPVVQRTVPQTGQALWLVTRHDLVRQVLADTRWSSEVDSDANRNDFGDRPGQDGMFLLQDPPRHTHYRRMLTGKFTLARMNALRPLIEQIVADQLDELEKSPRPADLVSRFALPVPSLVICELLGVPYSERDRFQETSQVLLSLTATLDEMQAAGEEVEGFVTEFVARQRVEPGDALIGDLIRTHGQDLRDDEIVQIAMLLLIAGHETTSNMIGIGALLLLRNPDQAALIRDGAPEAKGAVDELLRYLSIVDMFTLRRASQELTLNGQVFAPDEFVTTSLAAANRDPALCNDPDTLDITRPKVPHVAFGFGPHQCLGQNLARMELEIAYTGLFRRFPDLALAVPLEEVPFRTDMAIYGVHSLPVTW
ncbi:Cytochrome P450 [Sinosporangium album]|uniref:Cytochrome P450 n=1 Tax=Sinosporangium album TaxID=504805 RepID=A0A1G8FEH8_9ACTN|nr:cytochrome P450 [Sinosporangium album]SDH80452.1 Cytochrome P450 [Sinosporangium album]